MRLRAALGASRRDGAAVQDHHGEQRRLPPRHELVLVRCPSSVGCGLMCWARFFVGGPFRYYTDVIVFGAPVRRSDEAKSAKKRK